MIHSSKRFVLGSMFAVCGFGAMLGCSKQSAPTPPARSESAPKEEPIKPDAAAAPAGPSAPAKAPGAGL